jgi:hypothetical protein
MTPDLFPLEAREHHARERISNVVDHLAADAQAEIRFLADSARAWVNRCAGQRVRRIRERVGA